MMASKRKRSSEMRACSVYPGNPQPLDTLASVRTEMARVYRLTLQGKLEPETMTKLIYVLKEIRACIEADVFDEAPRRLAELEAKLEGRDG
jgi:hypothetical protein